MKLETSIKLTLALSIFSLFGSVSTLIIRLLPKPADSPSYSVTFQTSVTKHYKSLDEARSNCPPFGVITTPDGQKITRN